MIARSALNWGDSERTQKERAEDSLFRGIRSATGMVAGARQVEARSELVDTDPVALGARIAELRAAAGLTSAQAARRAGITAAYWHAVENASPQGRNRRPSIPRVPVLRAIADAVDGDRAELLDMAGHEDDAAIDRARAGRHAITVNTSGVDLEELRRTDPEAYDQIIGMARIALDRARRRRGGEPAGGPR